MKSRSTDSLLILADDLSGAADCAVGAARGGLSSVVLWGDTESEPTEQVVSIDTDTRYLSADKAAQVQSLLWSIHRRSHAVGGASPRLFYKKIDSTLRGNFAAEMAALRNTGVAIVAPAFISAGRTTQNGKVYVHGVPLEQTEIWANEGMQGDASIAAILSKHGLRCQHMDLEMVRTASVADWAQLVQSGAVDAIVCDAELESDLAAIAASTIGLPVYWVGSAGLIAHIPTAARLLSQRSTVPVPTVLGSIVTVVGSYSSVSREQATQLLAGAEVVDIPVAAEVLCAGPSHALWADTATRVEQALSRGADILIRTDAQLHQGLLNGPVLTQGVGRLLAPWVASIGALIATGGETARGLLTGFGVVGLQIVREIEVGAPLSVALGAHRFAVVTKAGAFGTATTLLNCYQELKAIRSNPKINFQ